MCKPPKTTEFSKHFQPNRCQTVDGDFNLTVRNNVYNHCEKDNYHIVFYDCLPEIIYGVVNANLEMLIEYNYSAIEILGALPYCPTNWMVCSTFSIIGEIQIVVSIEYMSSSEISHGNQTYVIRMNTIAENKVSFHQLIQRIEKRDKHKEWKAILDKETESNFEILELYEQNTVLDLEEEIFHKPRYGDRRIELSGLCCPDFYIATLL